VSTLKILLVGIFMVVAVMVLTAMIHLIAPYVAVLVVLGPALWILTREKPPDKRDE